MLKKKLIGAIAVDSGQIMIGDPCYLDDWEAGEVTSVDGKEPSGEFCYDGACLATLNEPGYGLLSEGAALATRTLYGDGTYPVYAWVDDDGGIHKIMIDFDPSDRAVDEIEAKGWS